MKEFIKKNYLVLLAFSLPLGLIVVIALYTYLPSLFLSTKYNFIYSTCSDNKNYYSYRCSSYTNQHFEVVNNKLTVREITIPTSTYEYGYTQPNIDGKPIYEYRLFLHDTQKNQSREISTSEAQTLTLNNLLTSPDGVSVSSSYDSGTDFFIFGGSRSTFGYYLTKGKARSKLNLINVPDNYYTENNFQFIGWVLPGRN